MPSNHIKLFFVLMLLGFINACSYHAIMDSMGMHWPWNTFLSTPNNQFSDWYDSVAQAASKNPYYASSIIAPGSYFPVTYVLLKVGVGYSSGTSIYIYFLISIVLLVLSVGLLRKQFMQNSIDSASLKIKDCVLLVLGCLISYPVLFALDRGNIDIWIGFLIIIFVVTQSTRFEIGGLLCLSLAISFKGYPAAFLVLLISDRKYRSAAICTILPLLMSAMTLYLMWDGFDRNLIGLLNNLNSFSRSYVLGSLSLFATSDPYNAIRIIIMGILRIMEKFISPNNAHLSLETVSIIILRIYSVLSLSFSALAAFFVLAIDASRWKKVTAICLIILIYPNISVDYKLCNLFAGLYLLLIEIKYSRCEKICFALFCLLLIPKSYYFIHGMPI